MHPSALLISIFLAARQVLWNVPLHWDIRLHETISLSVDANEKSFSHALIGLLHTPQDVTSLLTDIAGNLGGGRVVVAAFVVFFAGGSAVALVILFFLFLVGGCLSSFKRAANAAEDPSLSGFEKHPLPSNELRLIMVAVG